MKTAPVAAMPEVGSFEKRLAAVAELLEPKLDEVLPREGRLAEAMRYAVLGSGKRFRPFLVLESAALFGAVEDAALNVAAAIECLHCYSLVHDDLPAMDDDDMRRGKASVHKKFDEATAILAGDALQSLAFEIIAQESAELAVGLARASGWAGMAGGQQLDMEAERGDLELADVERIQRLKTGALIVFSAEAGAILSKAGDRDRRAIAMYANRLGIAYDIADQLADAQKDAAAGKATVVSILGMDAARELLRRTVDQALTALESFQNASALREAALFMLGRFK